MEFRFLLLPPSSSYFALGEETQTRTQQVNDDFSLQVCSVYMRALAGGWVGIRGEGGALFSYYMGHIGKEKKKKKKVLPINQRVGRHRRRKKRKDEGWAVVFAQQLTVPKGALRKCRPLRECVLFFFFFLQPPNNTKVLNHTHTHTHTGRGHFSTVQKTIFSLFFSIYLFVLYIRSALVRPIKEKKKISCVCVWPAY